jgi:hypothetical protein
LKGYDLERGRMLKIAFRSKGPTVNSQGRKPLVVRSE